MAELLNLLQVHTYVVFGNQQTHPSFHPRNFGIEPLSVMAVVCGKKLVSFPRLYIQFIFIHSCVPSHKQIAKDIDDSLNQVYGVWGDTNGNDGEPLVGESSLALGTLCYGDVVNGNNGHSRNNVMFIAFKGKKAVPGKNADWNAQSAEAFESSLEALGNSLVKNIPVGHD